MVRTLEQVKIINPSDKKRVLSHFMLPGRKLNLEPGETANVPYAVFHRFFSCGLIRRAPEDTTSVEERPWHSNAAPSFYASLPAEIALGGEVYSKSKVFNMKKAVLIELGFKHNVAFDESDTIKDMIEKIFEAAKADGLE